jgi:GH43 family beta-xylosidase
MPAVNGMPCQPGRVSPGSKTGRANMALLATSIAIATLFLGARIRFLGAADDARTRTGLLNQPGPAATTVSSADVAARGTFANPLYKGADPWVVRHEGHYYLCQSDNRSISIWKSTSPIERGERKVVWRAPASGWNRAQVWAPELHFVRGKWYIYYAASRGTNEYHRMGVLEAATDDPQGPYIDRGMLYTGDDVQHGTDDKWAIDGTVFEHRGRLYLAWSGWEHDRDIQFLYLAEMSNAWTVSSKRVRLCDNDTYAWERVGEDVTQRGLHEAPQFLARGGKVCLVYSCSASWQRTYKLGMLVADADLLDPKSWRKLDRPVFEPTDEVFGVGHCCFTTSPDGKEDWILYHSKVRRSEGWERMVRAQKFRWTEDGLPDFGRPIPNNVAIQRPSGEMVPAVSGSGAANQ